MVLSLEVKADGWDADTSTPIIAHIEDEDGKVDFYTAIAANKQVTVKVGDTAETVPVDGADVPVRPSMLGLTLPFNLTGWPATSVPGQVGTGELPVGVQVVGVRLEERGVLRVAAALHP